MSDLEATTIEMELSAALMGDASACSKIAQRLRDHADLPNRAAAAARQAYDFKQAAEWFQHEYRDVMGDTHAAARARELDMRLAREHPELTFRQRLSAVGRQVRAELDPSADEDEGRREGVTAILEGRHHAKLDDESIENTEDAFDAERRERIEEMRVERRRLQGFEE